MSLLDAQPSKPTLLERMTLQGLFSAFAIGAAASFVLEIIWIFVGFAFFTAKESDVPWYYPCATLITAILMLSVGGLIVTLLASAIQHFHGE